MKRQILFSMKSKNNIITLSSAQSAHNIVSVKDNMVLQKQVNTFTAHQQFSVWIGAKKQKQYQNKLQCLFFIFLKFQQTYRPRLACAVKD